MLNALELYRKYGQQDRAEAVQAQQMADQQAQREFTNNLSLVQMAQQQQARQQAMQQASQQRQQDMDFRRQQMGQAAQLQRERMGQAERIARERMQAARDTAAAKSANKPQLPAPALKLQNETIEEFAIADAQEKDLSAIKNQIDTGKLELGLFTNPLQSARNTLGFSNESSRNYDTFKASLEKMRTDSLRLNKGVQTEGDAQRAWNELLTNINDPKLVGERLDEIRAINKRAKNLKALQLDTIRQNFGAEPFDPRAIEAQRPAIGAPERQSGGWDNAKEQRLQELRRKRDQGGL